MFWMWRMLQRIGGWRAIVADALLAWRLFRDPRVPLKAKAILPAFVVYFFSPINLPFEWIPIIGQIDDVTIALLVLAAFLRLCPQELVAEHARALETQFADPERLARLGRFGRYGRYVTLKFDRWTGKSSGRPPGSRADGPPSNDRSQRPAA